MEKHILKYFFKGLAVVLPFVIVIYLLDALTSLSRFILPSEYEDHRIIGFLLVALVFIIIGFILERSHAMSFVAQVEKYFQKIPFIFYIYRAIKKMSKAFVGEDTVFDRPVWILREDGRERRLGFVTRDDMEYLGLKGHVAVYLPGSFTFTGETIVVSKKHIEPVEGSSAQVIGFAPSGGIRVDVEGRIDDKKTKE